VATQVDVFVGPISKVLNNKLGASDDIRKHVLCIAQALGYTSSFRNTSSFSQVIHLDSLYQSFIPDIASAPLFSEVLHGLEQVCRELKIALSFNGLSVGEFFLGRRYSPGSC
jgi:DNA-binding LacI/PurR family transcriptional regulator